jgi:hypothetical protein
MGSVHCDADGHARSCSLHYLRVGMLLLRVLEHLTAFLACFYAFAARYGVIPGPYRPLRIP